MLPSASVLARKHEERVQKAFSVDHHGPEDARLSHVLNPLSSPKCDYVEVLARANSRLPEVLAHSVLTAGSIGVRTLLATS